MVKQYRFLTLLLIAIFSLYSSEKAILQTILTCPDVFHAQTFDAALCELATENGLETTFHRADRHLFSAFPGLADTLPWMKLAQLPTPVKKLENLGDALGHAQLYLKDDGATDPRIGGNKLRKLEPVFADAAHKGATDVFTFGCVGSNLVTQVASCAQKTGFGCSVFLTPEPNSEMVRNNLLLDYLYDAQMYFYPNNFCRKISVLGQVADHKLNNGLFPYAIQTGASSALGAAGYVNAAFELKEQIKEGLLPKPDCIYIAVGSVGTIAGLAVGLAVAGLGIEIVAIGSFVDEFQEDFVQLATECNELLHGLDTNFPLIDVQTLPVTFDCDFVGRGYAYFTGDGLRAIEMFQTLEGVMLDGVYTGKCAAALIKHVRTRPELQNKVILFWNTFGIQEQVTDHELYKQLPESLHHFFTQPVQEIIS